jgi:hypothetical protein
MDATFLLKNGRLYEPGDVTESPVSIDEINGRYQLLLEDEAFFYISMGKSAISRKKLRAVAANFIRGQFPADLFAGFALCEISGEVLILLYTEAFGEFIKNNSALFRNASKISTVFCELTARYESFTFTDNKAIYEKAPGTVTQLSSETPGTLRAKEMYEAILPLKTDLNFEGIKREAAVRNYAVGAVALGICYLFFMLAGVFQIAGLSKQANLATAELNRYYQEAGVENSGDPYGVLRERASKGKLAPYKILSVLHSTGTAASGDITLENITVNDAVVRFEGSTATFAAVEEFKISLEKTLKKAVSLDESREAGGKVRFVMRFEP